MLRLAAVAVLVAVPALSSCGFDRATSRINQITAGDTVRDGTVDVLNALVVSSGPGSGTLVALLVNNDTDTAVALEGAVSGADDAPASVKRLEINPGGRRQLSEAEVRVEGDFVAGEVLDVTLSFDNGEEVEISPVVVTECDEYDGLDDAPLPDETTAPGADTEADDAYSCEAPESEEH